VATTYALRLLAGDAAPPSTTWLTAWLRSDADVPGGAVADEQAEGWYTDPYGRHEARWMSAGSPTKLVRDGGVESYDEPPDEEPSREATMIVEEPPPGTDDLRHAGEPDTAPSRGEVADAAVFGAVSTWHLHAPGGHRRR